MAQQGSYTMRARLITAANDVPINPSSPLKLKSMIQEAHARVVVMDKYNAARKKRRKTSVIGLTKWENLNGVSGN